MRRGMSSPSGGAMIFGADLVQAPLPGPAKRDPSLPRNVKALRAGGEDILVTRGDRKRIMRKLLVLKAQRGEIEV